MFYSNIFNSIICPFISLKLVLKIRDYKTLNIFKVCVKMFYDIVQKLNTTKEFLEYLPGLFMMKFRGHFES